MGADLIGYMLKGPKKFTAAKKKDALKKAIQIGMTAEAMVESKEAGEEWSPVLPWQKEAAKAIESALEQGSMPDLESFTREGAQDAFDKFLLAWEGGHRDVNVRVDPDDKTQVLFFTGGMSWGDSPGETFEEVERAFMYLIPDNLGVR